MISYDYNISEFVETAKGITSYFELLLTTENEVYNAEKLIEGGRRGAPRERERGCGKYIGELKGFLFFLRYGVRPSGTNSFESFRPICQNLIDSKVFEPEAINSFKTV